MKTKTAPMGWNSWDCYGAGVTEEIVRKNGEYMAKHLKKYGYDIITVDIQWSSLVATGHAYTPFDDLCMDGYSRLIPAENRFPSSAGGKGFKPLADYIHSLGLKFGIHIMRGIPRRAAHAHTPILGTGVTADKIANYDSTCFWNSDMYGVKPEAPGAREYYESIFALYAQWGVDFIKIDDICRELPRFEEELILISDCLKNCGRDIIFSLSPGPAVLEKSELYKQVADMWRITDDFWDRWDLLYNMFERCEKWSVHTGAGNWPDCDMLPVGALNQDEDPDCRTCFTKDEQITMMNLWCIFRSPLIIGGELTKTDDFTLSLLTNENVLRMHSLSRHAHQVWRRKVKGVECALWTAICAGGGQYAGVFNLGEESVECEIPLGDLELEGSKDMLELWSNEASRAQDKIMVNIRPHASAAFLITE